ncbi:DNA-binding protein [Salmonella enterica subsp. diarizonae]|uniref:DNA-binding protein n=1 Tax=Salmonella diarizonae TaxID=59204 RepID=A0A379TRH4_SALDZ|nr:DNA-binding protein [Salmonella enterica subsp. diarizonae]
MQSAQSLKTWKQAVERGDTRLTVVFGTKGRRPRETVILDAAQSKMNVPIALNAPVVITPFPSSLSTA